MATKKTTKKTAAAKKPAAKATKTTTQAAPKTETRRDFLVLTASATAGIGAVSAVWPFISSMNPAKDVLALGSTEIDISSMEIGQSIKAIWRGKPVFVRRRTAAEISQALADDKADLPDPQKDSDRIKSGKEEWLILVGVCTHLGCIPLGEAGDYNGWFCPCHGSHYDTSGRVRKGPAPTNMVIPPYEFLSDTTIKIG